MIRFLLAAAMIAVPTAAVADTAPRQRIIVDNSGECGSYRYAMHRRQDTERAARKLANKLEANGTKVDIVVINPGQSIGALNSRSGNWAPVISLYC